MSFSSLKPQRNVACFLTGGLTVPNKQNENSLIRAVSNSRLQYPCQQQEQLMQNSVAVVGEAGEPEASEIRIFLDVLVNVAIRIAGEQGKGGEA